MDNLYSNPALLYYLRYQGYNAIGTIRENRVHKGSPLTSNNTFMKKDRGYFQTAIEKNTGLLYVRWKENSVVTMISSSCGTEGVGQAKRFWRQQKMNICVSHPKEIIEYNCFMGSTDQMDQNLNCYRIGVRSKK